MIGRDVYPHTSPVEQRAGSIDVPDSKAAVVLARYTVHDHDFTGGE